jgi:hypothetical protein
MTKDSDGAPKLEASARGLGVRIRIDIPVFRDRVRPGTGGMSTTRDDPALIVRHRRPPSLGGTGRDPVWGCEEALLPAGLRLREDKAGPLIDHFLVEPSFEMPMDEYVALLGATRMDWKVILES